jgi:5-methylcytosine-specific restriction endonuclease McrA
MRRYRATDEYKAKRKEYENSVKRKSAKDRYRNSPSGKEYQRQYKKRYRKTSVGKQNIKKDNNIRETRKTQAGGSYTIQEWYVLCEFYDFCCLKCKKQFPFDKLTVDHIKPVSKGGTSFIWQLQPLCRSCNSSKGDKEIDYRKTLPDWIDRYEMIWVQDSLFR